MNVHCKYYSILLTFNYVPSVLRHLLGSRNSLWL